MVKGSREKTPFLSYRLTISSGIDLGGSSEAILGTSSPCRHTRSTVVTSGGEPVLLVWRCGHAYMRREGCLPLVVECILSTGLHVSL